ncbi:sensor histidine kinase [Ureibacillus acetophenoni]|uniref:histidine kinase n=1 Tax=Ureibacillus acetophenoni TaxID=614649 RepID=A0A285UF31_9BACL|nr:HAMP domain-containing sensor histidine kinase [Ureibacillus acetophenoni]SOC40432.1 signal transduction histidine kinase [Ureibacillus acetophenoni]
MKLRTKIHVFTTLLMLVLIVLVNFGVYKLYEQLSINTEYKQLVLRGEELVTTFNQFQEVSDPNMVLRSYIPSNGAINVINDRGKEMTSVQSPLYDPVQMQIGKNEQYALTEVKGIPTIMIEIPAIWTNGNVVKFQLIQQLNDVAFNRDLLKLILTAVTILVAIPIILSNMVLGSIILKPLEKLNRVMSKSTTSGTYEKIDESIAGKDELAEIGRTFNHMMEALETNYRKQQQFVSNASHELKTPLTVIDSYAKLLLRRGFTNEKIAKEALDAIVSESNRMKDLIAQMLELAKNKEYVSISIGKVNLSQLLKDVTLQLKQAYNREFQLQIEPSLFVNTDEQRLKQLLYILLDNARKYSDDKIVLKAGVENNNISIAIQDFGVGIPEEQLPHLFDRFYRVKEDRNRKTGGTGLGLAIAKELSDLLQIEIIVESEINVGTTFRLMIPLNYNERNEVDSQ